MDTGSNWEAEGTADVCRVVERWSSLVRVGEQDQARRNQEGEYFILAL